MGRWIRAKRHNRGQALVELALILPLFLIILFGIIILGIGLFYQQQVTNAAREAARYGEGDLGTYAPPDTYVRYFTPDNRWQVGGEGMTPHARQRIFGFNEQRLQVAACWSGYRNNQTGSFDAPPPGQYTINSVDVTIDSTWDPCLIDGHDPTAEPNQIGCTSSLVTVDTASSMSEGPGVIIGNKVTAYACLEWNPPLAGFLLIPETVTLRGVISEPLQRQQ